MGLNNRAEEWGLAGDCKPNSASAESCRSSRALVLGEMVRSCSIVRHPTQVGLKAELYQEQKKIHAAKS
jgi:hypothetical protein